MSNNKTGSSCSSVFFVSLFCLAFSLSSFGAELCSFGSSNPKEGMKQVPLNAEIVLTYMSLSPHVCRNFSIHDSHNEVVPIKIVLHDEYSRFNRKGFYGDLLIKPVKDFDPHETYSIFMNNVKKSSFTTARKMNTARRGVIEKISPLNIVIPHLPLTHYLTRDDLRTAPMRIAFDLRESELPTQADSWRAFVNVGNKIGNDILRRMPALARNNFSHSALSLVLSLYFPHLAYPEVRYAVSFHKAIYRTVTPNGAPVSLSAVVIIPEGKSIDYRKIPIFSYQHATVLNGTAQTDTDTFETLVGALLASRGYIVVATDSLGFGLTKSEVEPYLMQSSEVMEYYDLIAAVRLYFYNRYHIDLPSAVSLMGVSQGAHTSLAMVRYMIARDRQSVGFVYAADGPYNLQKMFWSYASMVNRTDSKNDPYLTYVRPHQFFMPVFMRRYLKAIATYSALPSDTFEYGFYDILGLLKRSFVREIFQDKHRAIEASLSFDTLTNKLSSLHPYLLLSSGPEKFFLYHEERDPIVPYQNTVDLMREMKKVGFQAVQKGNCRKKVLFSEVVASLAQFHGHAEWMHVSCVPWVLNDLLGNMPEN